VPKRTATREGNRTALSPGYLTTRERQISCSHACAHNAPFPWSLHLQSNRNLFVSEINHYSSAMVSHLGHPESTRTQSDLGKVKPLANSPKRMATAKEKPPELQAVCTLIDAQREHLCYRLLPNHKPQSGRLDQSSDLKCPRPLELSLSIEHALLSQS
jgi:hypothetical protein